MFGKIDVVGNYLTLFHSKYISCRPYGLKKNIFTCLWELLNPLRVYTGKFVLNSRTSKSLSNSFQGLNVNKNADLSV